jgi:hypothetical protein
VREVKMPTRRIFEIALVVAFLSKPALGLVNLWAAKTLVTQPNGSIPHSAAEIWTVMS